MRIFYFLGSTECVKTSEASEAFNQHHNNMEDLTSTWLLFSKEVQVNISEAYMYVSNGSIFRSACMLVLGRYPTRYRIAVDSIWIFKLQEIWWQWAHFLSRGIYLSQICCVYNHQFFKCILKTPGSWQWTHNSCE